MKKDIHPTYQKDAKVSCACGNSFTVGSTMPEIKVELCSACHPFYTGKQKIVDTARRVEKFAKRMKVSKEMAEVKKARKTAKAVEKKDDKKTEEKKGKTEVKKEEK